MNDRAIKLAAQLTAFNNKVMGFVETCTSDTWKKTSREDWSVGVVARHIAAGHYQVMELAEMIINKQPLPVMSMEDIVRSSNEHAELHADCNREEVLHLLKENGERLTAFVSGLKDEELSRTGHLDAMEGDVSAENLLKLVILDSGGEHFQNMEKAANS